MSRAKARLTTFLISLIIQNLCYMNVDTFRLSKDQK